MALILAAGQGLRLRPLTHDRPKALLPAAGLPLIAHLIEALKEDVHVIVGHGARAVQSYLQSGDDLATRVTYTTQKAQLGPGHALFQARDAIEQEEFLVLAGDSWYAPELIERLKAVPAPAMLQVPDARSARHGVPVTRGEEVAGLLEADEAGPRATRFCGGAYKLKRSFFTRLAESDYSMRDAIRRDLKAGPWHLVEAQPGEYVDVIEVQDLLRVQDILMQRLEPIEAGTIEAGAIVQGPVNIEEGSVIRAGSIVQGPVFIGRHCEIGPGAVLMPGTSIRNRVRVSPLTVLQRCIVQSNTTIGSHTRIEDVVVDNGATIGSHVHFEAGQGTIVGADARLGDRVTVQAAAIIGRGASVATGRTVKDVPDGGQAV